MLKKILLVIVLCIILIFIFKDTLAANLIKFYIKNEFAAECTIEEVQVFFTGLEIKNLEFQTEDFKGGLAETMVALEFHQFLKVKDIELTLNGAVLQISDLANFQKILKNKYSPGLKRKPKKPSRLAVSLYLDLIDIDIKIKDPLLTLDTSLSFQATVEGGRLKSLRNLEIAKGNLRKGNIALVFDAVKSGPQLSILRIDSLKIKEKEIDNIIIPLAVDDQQLLLKSLESEVLGQVASVSGSIDFRDYDNLCLFLNMAQVSFGNIISLAEVQESFSFEGIFSGDVKICLKGQNLSSVEGGFYNDKGGLINIKKEADIAFLKRHLDQESYEAIIDNFKNYHYNEGKIKVKKENKILNLELNFDSQDLGKRDITINFHK